MFDSFAMIRPLKMRWMLTCVATGFLLAVTPAGAQDYEATRHAAEQGDADAQFNLGFMYATGRGVPPCTAPGSLDTHLCYAAWRSSYSSRASIGV